MTVEKLKQLLAQYDYKREVVFKKIMSRKPFNDLTVANVVDQIGGDVVIEMEETKDA